MAKHTRGRAALALTVITPLSAELTLGNPPLRMVWLMLLWIPIYGAGTLLIRELVRRRGGGWPSVLLYGLAYGIVEEGLVLQALSSPTMYGAADWAPRILGLNSAYTELNLPYHAVFSVAIPILLTDLLFPSLRDQPYLGRTGLWVTGAVFVLGGLLLRVGMVPFLDPGYQVPVPLLVGYLVAIGALCVAASRPGRTVAHGGAPRPWVLAAAGAVAAFGYLALLFPFAGLHLGVWGMAGALLLLVGAAVLLRWWSDLHALALAGGALAGHTAFGVVANADTVADRVSLALLGVLMVALLWRLKNSVSARSQSGVS
ncbi:MAG: hypothetical protein HOY71_46860 [Nonomuraea sp.]|nr:hypothetical protein [Nonomuraea sp.]